MARGRMRRAFPLWLRRLTSVGLLCYCWSFRVLGQRKELSRAAWPPGGIHGTHAAHVAFKLRHLTLI